MNLTKFFFTIIIVSFSGLVSGQSFNIMTYNIRYDNPHDGENQWTNRKEFLCDQIAGTKPDILGIQEGLHHQVMYLDSVFIDYTYVGIGRDDGKKKGEYSAIFYNHKKFEVLESSTFWLSSTPNIVSVGWDASMERICTYGLFRNKNTGQKIWVFNTHFDHIGNEARSQSARLIWQKINELNKGKLPVILMGDFNLKPISEPILYIASTLQDSKTISLSIAEGPVGTFNGFRISEPILDRIDYVFVSKNNIQVNKYAVLSDIRNLRYPSDHLPVLVELTCIPSKNK